MCMEHYFIYLCWQDQVDQAMPLHMMYREQSLCLVHSAMHWVWTSLCTPCLHQGVQYSWIKTQQWELVADGVCNHALKCNGSKVLRCGVAWRWGGLRRITVPVANKPACGSTQRQQGTEILAWFYMLLKVNRVCTEPVAAHHAQKSAYCCQEALNCPENGATRCFRWCVLAPLPIFNPRVM